MLRQQLRQPGPLARTGSYQGKEGGAVRHAQGQAIDAMTQAP